MVNRMGDVVDFGQARIERAIREAVTKFYEEKMMDLELYKLLKQVAELPMTSESPGVHPDELLDDIIDLSRMWVVKNKPQDPPTKSEMVATTRPEIPVVELPVSEVDP